MRAMASQITSISILDIYSTVFSGADQRKHQSSSSLAFVRGIHQSPVNSPHKWPVTQKMYPFDDVIMKTAWCGQPIRSTEFLWWECTYRPFVQGICLLNVDSPNRGTVMQNLDSLFIVSFEKYLKTKQDKQSKQFTIISSLLVQIMD